MNVRSGLLNKRNLLLLVAALMVVVVAAATTTALIPQMAQAKYSPACKEYRCDAGGGNKSEGGPPGADLDPGNSSKTKAKSRD